MLSRIDENLLFFAAIVAFLVVIELGFRLGLRHGQLGDDGALDHVKALQAALLGLLALLLGFNFAMASSRFDARKALIQDEVNAIGTTWQRAYLLPPPQRQEVSALLKQYVAARIDFMSAGIDEARIDAANAKASDVEAKIWKVTGAMVADGTGGSQLTPLILSLNEMVNVQWKRRTLLDNHVPEPVLHLLFIVAIGALGFIGYGYGLTGRRRHGTTAIFALLIAMVLATILDFDRPRGGFIRVGEEGLVRLQTSLEHPRP
jgi:hypothetical protein